MPTVLGVIALWLGALTLGASAARAEDFIATLTLDEYSLVSFGDEAAYSIPSGSTIRFRFATSVFRESAAVWIEPTDVRVGPLILRSSEEKLLFALAAPAMGLVTRKQDGSLAVDVETYLNITSVHPGGNSIRTVRMRFTTEGVEAANPSGTMNVSISGMRLNPSTRAIELVGTSTTPESGYPVPNVVVSATLRGTFDRLPAVE